MDYSNVRKKERCGSPGPRKDLKWELMPTGEQRETPTNKEMLDSAFSLSQDSLCMRGCSNLHTAGNPRGFHGEMHKVNGAVGKADCRGWWWMVQDWMSHGERDWREAIWGRSQLSSKRMLAPSNGPSRVKHAEVMLTAAGCVALVPVSWPESTLNFRRNKVLGSLGLLTTLPQNYAGLLELIKMDLDPVCPHCLPLTAETHLK